MPLSPCSHSPTFCWDEVTGERQGWTPFVWLSSVELTGAMGSPGSFWNVSPLETPFHQHEQRNRSRNLHLGGLAWCFCVCAANGSRARSAPCSGWGMCSLTAPSHCYLHS